MRCPDSRRDFITHHQGPPGVRWILRGWSHQVKCQSRGSSEGDWQQRASGEGPEPEGAGNQCSQSPSSQVLRTQACALTWFMKRPCDSQLTRLCSESRARAVREPSPNTRPVSKAGPPEFPPPTCVQGRAVHEPPKVGPHGPPQHLCPRQGHLGSHPPPVSKEGPRGPPPAGALGEEVKTGPPAPLLPAWPTGWF